MTVTLRTLTADDTAALDQVRQFFRNYAAWLGVDLCFQNFDQEMASLPGAYAAPAGRLFFAEVDGRPAGCVGIRPFAEGTCEMKRLYVTPEERGQGVGMALAMAAIKAAKYWDLGPDDVIMTVATDGSAMYGSEITKAMPKYFGNRFDGVAAGETWGRAIGGAATDHLIELTHVDRKRIFNLGYFTWVEQQGKTVAQLDALKSQDFWAEQRASVSETDRLIKAWRGA